MIIAVKRLQKEAQQLHREPPQYIRARPTESDILTFHYVLEGPPDTPYAGGYYHGLLRFNSEYPMKPPSVLMLTPNGRFAVNTRLCLSMSDFHPESWNPSWSVSTILIGLLSFMVGNDDTLGSIKTGVEERRKLARESLEANCANKEFRTLFPELVELAEDRRRKAAAAAALSGGAGAGAAASSSGGAGGAGGAGVAAAAAAAAAGAGEGPARPVRKLSSSLLLLAAIAAVVLFLYLQRFSGADGSRKHRDGL